MTLPKQYQIGIDEAGYGPNLGPLVVAASVWEVPDHLPTDPPDNNSSGDNSSDACNGEPDLYRLLEAAIAYKAGSGRMAIADSKKLYKPGGGLRQLERAVHGTLATLQRPATNWSTLVERLQADSDKHHHQLPWFTSYDCSLPVDIAADEAAHLGEMVAGAMRTAGCRLVDLQARLVFPAELNGLIDRHDSKGAALSHVTLGMLREILVSVNEQASSNARHFRILCDKHGGRNRYGPLLEAHFPDSPIQILTEGRAESRYRGSFPGKPSGAMLGAELDISFRAKGDSFLPAALASMTAKYLRELAMGALNTFWQAELPGLKATAGYPVDAKRFWAEIGTVQHKLGIPDHLLWRNR